MYLLQEITLLGITERIRNNMTKINKDDYVRVDKDGKLVEGYNVVYHASVVEEELQYAKRYNQSFIPLTQLPKKIQAKYLKHFKFMGV